MPLLFRKCYSELELRWAIYLSQSCASRFAPPLVYVSVFWVVHAPIFQTMAHPPAAINATPAVSHEMTQTIANVVGRGSHETCPISKTYNDHLLPTNAPWTTCATTWNPSASPQNCKGRQLQRHLPHTRNYEDLRLNQQDRLRSKIDIQIFEAN